MLEIDEYINRVADLEMRLYNLNKKDRELKNASEDTKNKYKDINSKDTGELSTHLTIEHKRDEFSKLSDLEIELMKQKSKLEKDLEILQNDLLNAIVKEYGIGDNDEIQLSEDLQSEYVAQLYKYLNSFKVKPINQMNGYTYNQRIEIIYKILNKIKSINRNNQDEIKKIEALIPKAMEVVIKHIYSEDSIKPLRSTTRPQALSQSRWLYAVIMTEEKSKPSIIAMIM